MEIYAEISKRLAKQIENGAKFYLPDGVAVQKVGKRAYFFDCDENTKGELINFLEGKGISWQENDEPTTQKKSAKKQNYIMDLTWTENIEEKTSSKPKERKDQEWGSQH